MDQQRKGMDLAQHNRDDTSRRCQIDVFITAGAVQERLDHWLRYAHHPEGAMGKNFSRDEPRDVAQRLGQHLLAQVLNYSYHKATYFWQGLRALYIGERASGCVAEDERQSGRVAVGERE